MNNAVGSRYRALMQLLLRAYELTIAAKTTSWKSGPRPGQRSDANGSQESRGEAVLAEAHAAIDHLAIEQRIAGESRSLHKGNRYIPALDRRWAKLILWLRSCREER